MGALRSTARRLRRRATSASEVVLAPLFGVVVGVHTSEPVAALGFDDGPDPRWTPEILELLARHGARATFFVIGQQAARYPSLLARIRSEGHGLGNHTWSHRSLPRLGWSERREELCRPERALGDDLDRVVRPPFGHFDTRSWLQARMLGQRVVTWTGHAEDWREMDPVVLLGRMQQALRPGAILLLHDRLHYVEHPQFEDRSAMLLALDVALASAQATRFVPVRELLELGPPVRRLWWRRGSDDWLDGLQRPDER